MTFTAFFIDKNAMTQKQEFSLRSCSWWVTESELIKMNLICKIYMLPRSYHFHQLALYSKFLVVFSYGFFYVHDVYNCILEYKDWWFSLGTLALRANSEGEDTYRYSFSFKLPFFPQDGSKSCEAALPWLRDYFGFSVILFLLLELIIINP